MFSPNCTNQRHLRSKHLSLQHPTSLKYFDNNTLAAPRSFVLDGAISYGGSSGAGTQLIKKAYGEYWERNHFQTAVPVSKKMTLNEVFPLEHRKKLLNLCNQSDKEKIEDHLFSFTRVRNLFDETPYDYFYNAISLHTLSEDAPFLSVTDSIACASHPIKDQAIYHSLIEFLERQALVGSWLSMSHRYSISADVLGSITPYQGLYDALTENGNLYLFEIGNLLPAYSVIIFYFAQSEEDIVQYAVGSKSGLSLREAINSAFDELYQTYTMLYQTNSSSKQFENKAGSGYHAAFPQFNTVKTKEIIPYFNQSVPHKINTEDDLKALPIVSLPEALSSLQEISNDVFFYHHYDSALQLHYTKILSFDFFAHMSLKRNLSLDGQYAKKLKITADNAYLTPLPFP